MESIACARARLIYEISGLEKVYENALLIKLREKRLVAVQQAPVNVLFEGELVGEYFADILVENKVVLELKAVTELSKVQRFNWSIT